MSLEVSAAPISTTKSKPDIDRRVADYHPTIWGQYFLQYGSNQTTTDSRSEQFESSKTLVKNLLTSEKASGKLELIDSIQRLGIAYHFQGEIQKALQDIFDGQLYHDKDACLRTAALGFRLLRQERYNVPSSGIFNKFLDENGSFKEELSKDVQGILSLYEASQLSVHGEELLDEALAFSLANLKAPQNQLTCPSLKAKVAHALKMPFRKNVTRQEARDFISLYEQDEQHNATLLYLAKLDFNVVQKLHQEELSHITKWWKDLDFANKLPYARDRLVEGYYWPLGVFSEPQFSNGRSMLTKATAVISVVDDTYDAYGTIEELELFTKSLECFDVSRKAELPSYMQILYQALLDLFNDIENEMAKEGRSHLISYTKEEMKKLAKAYLLEARWLNANYVPTIEEYMRNGLITSVIPLLINICFCGMGEIASKEVFDWLSTEPKIVMAASTNGRLMDDIASHKFEQSRGHVASAVECYMNQHKVSEEEAYVQLYKLVDNGWKDINEELLKPTPAAPVPLLTCILNYARVIDVVYKDADTYTHSKDGPYDNLKILLTQPLTI